MKVDDESAWEVLDFWFCECKTKPSYMYFVDGEYRKTLTGFWRSYDSFPLQVIHTLVNEIDDLDDEAKRNNFRVERINSIDELDLLLNEIGWKLGEEKFFITNSFLQVEFILIVEQTLKGKETAQYPIFELGIGETLTDTILHGQAFVIGDNDFRLSTKEQVSKMVVTVK